MPKVAELLRSDNIDRLIKARLTTSERIDYLLSHAPQKLTEQIQYQVIEHEKELEIYDRLMREPPGPTYVKVRGRKRVKEGWK